MPNSKEWEAMFTRKEWLWEFNWLNFREYSIVDIRYGEDELYDVSTRKVSAFAPDFLKEDGQFDYRQYCICLIKTVLELSFTDIPEFLKYQSARMESPIHWLCKFEKLLELNKNFSLMKSSADRFELIREAINDECFFIATGDSESSVDLPFAPDAVHEPLQMYYLEKVVSAIEETNDYSEHISICKNARDEYFYKVANASKTDLFFRAVEKWLDVREALVSKTREKEVWLGTAKALARYHVLENMPRDGKGRFVIRPDYAREARIVCERFISIKGTPFRFETIQKEIGKIVRSYKS